MSERKRLWSFTSFKKEAPEFKNMRWLAYQQEKCPTSGKLHWQGAVAYENALSMKGAIERLGGGISVEAARNWEALKEYVKKKESSVEGTYKEFGTDEQKGKRNDLEEFRDYVLENGVDEFEILMRFPGVMARYPKFIDKIKSMMSKQKKEFIARGIIFIVGESGSGKTSLVYNSFGADKVYDFNYLDKWFDGLDEQEVILMDDVTGIFQIKRDFLLKVSDGYPMQVPVKGGHTNIPEGSTIVITSNNKEEIECLLEDQAVKRRTIGFFELNRDKCIAKIKDFGEFEFNDERNLTGDKIKKCFKEIIKSKNDGVQNSSLSEASDVWSTEESDLSQVSQDANSSYGSEGLRSFKVCKKVDRDKVFNKYR